MSGRIRTVKPELLEDAVTAGLSDSAFRVFIGMFLLADDYGNLRAEKGYLEGQIYWSAIPEKSVPECLKELSGDSHEGLVRLYRVRGQAYAHIRGWSKHQKVQHPGKPRVPGPELRDDGGPRETLTKVPETLTPDLRSPTSDHDPEQKGESETLATAPAAPPELEDPEPEETTGIRHVSSRPPPPAERTPCDLDARKVYDAIRAEPKLAGVDAYDLAAHAQFAGEKDRPVAWLLEAVSDAARATPPGELVHVTQKRVHSYLKYAKGPKPGAAKPPALRDDSDPEVIARIQRMPKRVTAQSVPLVGAGREQALAAMAQFGKGPPSTQAPRQASTEAELADKARVDRQRLADGWSAPLPAKRKALSFTDACHSASEQAREGDRYQVVPRPFWRRRKPKAPPPLNIGDEVTVRAKVVGVTDTATCVQVAGYVPCWVQRGTIVRAAKE